MAKIIVTHLYPDLDAVCSVWLIKRFLPGWQKAEVRFVPPGEYLIDHRLVDSDPNLFYVDTGRGRFDHHQTNKYICAATLVWDYVKREIKKEDEAIERLVKIVNQIDHAQDLVWPKANDDRYEMMLHLILEGFKQARDRNSEEIIRFGLEALDGVYKMYQKKISAEEEIKRGKEFKTRWGKAVAVESKNDTVVFVGEKKGYSLVAQLNREIGHLRIFGRWDRKVNLKKAWEEFKKRDPKPFWFLHSSKVILMNGTPTQPNYHPTKLSLEEVIKILKKA